MVGHHGWYGLLVGLLATSCVTAAPPVLLRVEAEAFGLVVGPELVEAEGASAGRALRLGGESTVVIGGFRVPAGEYTLMLRTFSPAGDQDGFFVEINGERTRRTSSPSGRWLVLAYPFRVVGNAPVTVRILGQEPGLRLDQIAVVKGRAADRAITFEETPTGEAVIVPVTELPDVALPLRLATVPEGPLTADADTVLLENFDAGLPAGALGAVAAVPGAHGGGLQLDMMDGRLEIDASGWPAMPAGTIEFYLRPRPAARIWHDQGWRFFAFLQPAAPDGFQLACYRHPVTHLRLSASRGEGPYDQGGEPVERCHIDTNALALEPFHHLLISWDLTGEEQRIWLLVNGTGESRAFPARYPPDGRFAKLVIGNRPEVWDVPWLPLDGVIDDLRVSRVSVRDRLLGQ